MPGETEFIDWTPSEVVLIVADYFDMLQCELLEQSYNKAAHRRALRDRLESRSNGSIEYKHRNISGVLIEMGLPYIDGYKPLSHRQNELVEAIESYLSSQTNFFIELLDSPRINPKVKKREQSQSFSNILDQPPERIVLPPDSQRPWITRKLRRVNFVERDALNRQLGRSGEEFIVELERLRLKNLGRNDLAQKVEWVSKTIGDGLGFDVLSFDEQDESERLIEVKTTGLGKFFPFYVTINELNCSEDVADQFHLYRIFNFSKSPRLFILKGSLADSCRLEPIKFRGIV